MIALYALVKNLGNTSLRVLDNQQLKGEGQGREGGRYRGDIGYKWGNRDGRCDGPITCYNCDEVRHMDRDFLVLRRPWCSNGWVNNHVIEYFSRVIVKWEAKNRKHTYNLIN